MSQEQLVMQDAELEFDEELETHEEEEVQGSRGRGRRDDFR
jgi:RNA polymerase nonessential primary-like sigma factor